MVAVASPVAVSARRPSNYPWVMHNDSLGEDVGGWATGGSVMVLTAAAALNIGDAVFISAAFTVNKSTTAGNQVLRTGVVVGGVARSMESGTLEVQQRLPDLGLAAAATSDPVLVCYSGICMVVLDSAGAVAAGVPVKLSTTTSGRVTVATANTDAGKILGYAIDAGTSAGDKMRILVALG